jgi:hypothetical protein
VSAALGLPLVGVLLLLLAKVQDIAHRDWLIRDWQQRNKDRRYALPRDRSYESLLRETSYLDTGRASVARDVRPPRS